MQCHHGNTLARRLHPLTRATTCAPLRARLLLCPGRAMRCHAGVWLSTAADMALSILCGLRGAVRHTRAALCLRMPPLPLLIRLCEDAGTSAPSLIHPCLTRRGVCPHVGASRASCSPPTSRVLVAAPAGRCTCGTRCSLWPGSVHATCTCALPASPAPSLGQTLSARCNVHATDARMCAVSYPRAAPVTGPATVAHNSGAAQGNTQQHPQHAWLAVALQNATRREWAPGCRSRDAAGTAFALAPHNVCKRRVRGLLHVCCRAEGQASSRAPGTSSKGRAGRWPRTTLARAW